MVKKIDFVLCVSARPITNHIIYLYFITNKMLHISSWCFIIIFFHFILISVSNSPSFSRYLFKIQSSQTTHKPWKHKPLNKSGKNIVIIYTLFINLFILSYHLLRAQNWVSQLNCASSFRYLTAIFLHLICDDLYE